MSAIAVKRRTTPSIRTTTAPTMAPTMAPTIMFSGASVPI